MAIIEPLNCKAAFFKRKKLYPEVAQKMPIYLHEGSLQFAKLINIWHSLITEMNFLKIIRKPLLTGGLIVSYFLAQSQCFVCFLSSPCSSSLFSLNLPSFSSSYRYLLLSLYSLLPYLLPLMNHHYSF